MDVRVVISSPSRSTSVAALSPSWLNYTWIGEQVPATGSLPLRIRFLRLGLALIEESVQARLDRRVLADIVEELLVELDRS